MRVQIFDVEHGACALVTTDTDEHILIDCGHNSTTGWRPSTYLPSSGITTLERLVITNYDEDHVSDLPDLLGTVRPQMLFRNRTVSPHDLELLKSETGAGPGIERLVAMAQEYSHPVTSWPDLGGLALKTFYNSYPADFDDENNLSMAVFLDYHGFCMLFPGDLETAGWKKLLEHPDFVQHLMRVTVLVASHHGRESGCCEEMFELGWLPQVVIMSDAGIQYETQATVPWYAARSQGIQYAGQSRSVFTTRRDGRIAIEVSSAGWAISTSREEERAVMRTCSVADRPDTNANHICAKLRLIRLNPVRFFKAARKR